MNGDVDGATAALLAAFDDPLVDEVLVNGTLGAWLVTTTGPRAFATPFDGVDGFSDWLLDFAAARGVRLDPVAGSAGGSFREEAFRWHAVLPPLSRDGPLFSMRRHRFDRLTVGDFGGSSDVKRRLMRALRLQRPILIAGPTGSGKTSLLAALLKEGAAGERIVVLESTAELPTLSPYCVRLQERPPSVEGRRVSPPISMEALLAEALRLRPDRLVIGEIRAGEARAFLDAARTGHGGTVATIHAEGPEAARARLAELAYGRAGGPYARRCEDVAVVMMARGHPPKVASIDGDLGHGHLTAVLES